MKKRKELGIIVVIFIMIVLMFVSSYILSLIGFSGDKTIILNQNLTTDIIESVNLFSFTGLGFILTNFLRNVINFEPLILIVYMAIFLSVLESSEILKVPAKKFALLPNFVQTFLVLFVCFILSILGNASYVILIPLFAILYKEAGRNPINAIITTFIGLTLASGIGMLLSYNDVSLGALTSSAAVISVDDSYVYSTSSYLYIKLVTAFIVMVVGTYLFERWVSKKIPKMEENIDIEEEHESLAFRVSAIVFVLLFAGFILLLTLVPAIANNILFMEGTTTLERLFSPNSGFVNSILGLLLISTIIVGYINMKIKDRSIDIKEYSNGFDISFDKLGYSLVLIMFFSQFIALLNYSRIPEVIAVNVVHLISALSIGGIALIIFFFVATIAIGLFMPSTILKWELMSPLLVPLFMRANMTPEFSQFIFMSADGVAKSLTPIFIFYIIILGFIKKYNGGKSISMFGTFRLIAPMMLVLAAVILIIIVSFYIIGLPIGPIGGIVI